MHPVPSSAACACVWLTRVRRCGLLFLYSVRSSHGATGLVEGQEAHVDTRGDAVGHCGAF